LNRKTKGRKEAKRRKKERRRKVKQGENSEIKKGAVVLGV
jgi:hypothetical protein